MTEFDVKILSIANDAVYAAQEENRSLGIANVYSLNGTIVWQLPDGTIATVDPNESTAVREVGYGLYARRSAAK